VPLSFLHLTLFTNNNRYEPCNGKFAGQSAYGYKSFSNFIAACASVNDGTKKESDFDDGSLASVHTTLQGTSILEAGRRSLDNDGRPFDIVYDGDGDHAPPKELVPHDFK